MRGDATGWSQQLASSGRVEFRVSRHKVGRLALAGACLTLASGVMFLSKVGGPDVGGTVLAGLGFVFFGLCFVLGVWTLVRGGAAFAVTTEGVEADASHPGRAIPWDQVVTAEVVRQGRDRIVQLHLTDGEFERQADVNAVSRALSGVSERITGGPAVWLPRTTTADPEELAQWLQDEAGRRSRALG